MVLCMRFFVYFVIFVLNNYQCIREILANGTPSSPSASIPILGDAMQSFQKRRQDLNKAREQFNRTRRIRK